ncbi:MAG: hypothetical protein ACTSPI_14495, partial [Candidatus Heimdallarchaeaceae archaeon]
KVVWDTSGLLNDQTTEVGKFLRALFGYQDKPTWLEIIAYIAYLIVILIVLLFISFRNKEKKEEIPSNVRNIAQ